MSRSTDARSAADRASSRVTVIMPVRNGMPFLPSTLASVAAQSHRDLQCLAIDDGSSDGSRAVLDAAGGWTVLETPGGGPNPARQLALGRAEGAYVTFLDQDDVWHRDHLAGCLAALRRDPDAAAVVAPRQVFRQDPQLRLGRRTSHPARLDPWAVFPIAVIDTPSMVVMRTDRLRAAGGWPDDRVLGSDPLLWWRLSTKTPLAISGLRSVGVRHSAGSLSARQRQWPLEYTRQLQRAMRDALGEAGDSLRMAVEPRAELLMQSLLELLDALLQGRSPADPARQLERSLHDASDSATVAAIGFLGWLLAREMQGDGPDEGADVVRSLMTEWPADAVRSGVAIRRMVAAVAAPARIRHVLRSKPGNLRLWRTMFESMAFRTARRMGRIDDPLALPLGCLSRRTGDKETS